MCIIANYCDRLGVWCATSRFFIESKLVSLISIPDRHAEYDNCFWRRPRSHPAPTQSGSDHSRRGISTLQWRHNERNGVSITSPTIVQSTVYSGAVQRKHQSFASLAFVQGIHRWPVNSPHKGPVTRKMFPFDDVIMSWAVSKHSFKLPTLQVRCCIRGHDKLIQVRGQAADGKFCLLLASSNCQYNVAKHLQQ